MDPEKDFSAYLVLIRQGYTTYEEKAKRLIRDSFMRAELERAIAEGTLAQFNTLLTYMRKGAPGYATAPHKLIPAVVATCGIPETTLLDAIESAVNTPAIPPTIENTSLFKLDAAPFVTSYYFHLGLWYVLVREYEGQQTSDLKQMLIEKCKGYKPVLGHPLNIKYGDELLKEFVDAAISLEMADPRGTSSGKYLFLIALLSGDESLMNSGKARISFPELLEKIPTHRQVVQAGREIEQWEVWRSRNYYGR